MTATCFAAPVVSKDPGVQACFEYLNTTQHFPDPSTTELLSFKKRFVAVKQVGARQMLALELRSKNEYGMYASPVTMECLLMGNGQTVNKGSYELL